MTAVMATACGSKHTQTQENAAETTTEAADAETKAADTTKPDLSNVDPKMAEGPGAFETDESSEGVQVEEISGEEQAKLQSEVAAKLEKTDYKSYAKELVEIVKSKDMEASISSEKISTGSSFMKSSFVSTIPPFVFTQEINAGKSIWSARPSISLLFTISTSSFA